MTTEYYQVEESTNGEEYCKMYDDRLTLAEAMARAGRQRRKEVKRARGGDIVWQYRIVKVTETREVVNESEAMHE